MTSVALFQQQANTKSRHSVLMPVGGAWNWWTPETIAMITQSPVENVQSDWPLLYAALETYGIADYNTCRVAIATVAIETAHRFVPVREAFWLDDQYGYAYAEQWRRDNLRYYEYYGRGHIQLTWRDNYEYYGWRIGHPELVEFPDKALVSAISVQVLAVYFSERGVSDAAKREDWYECRRLVQGAYAGAAELVDIIEQLDTHKLDVPYALSHVLELGYSRIGDPYVWGGKEPGSFDCSGYVAWCYDGRVTSYTDAMFDETYSSPYPYPGDINLYEYYDVNQPNTRFPHVGLWISEQETLDDRYGYGVGVHPHLSGAKIWVRRVPGVVVDTVTVAAA